MPGDAEYRFEYDILFDLVCELLWIWDPEFVLDTVTVVVYEGDPGVTVADPIGEKDCVTDIVLLIDPRDDPLPSWDPEFVLDTVTVVVYEGDPGVTVEDLTGESDCVTDIVLVEDNRGDPVFPDDPEFVLDTVTDVV
jgi:hypothetical protein